MTGLARINRYNIILKIQNKTEQNKTQYLNTKYNDMPSLE